MTSHIPHFRPLTGLYEPSAVQQLADGRFLVVEDEKTQPLSVFSLTSDGAVDSRPLRPGWFESDDAFWQLADLEGLTGDRQGRLYAITSHSRTRAGEEKKARDKLVRFRVEGERVRDTQLVTGLKTALLAAHPVLATAAEVLNVKSQGGLNIEAMEMRPDQTQLLVGFRGPLREGRALIAHIDNPDGMFDAGEPPRVSATLTTLDLGGQGIRGLCHVPDLDGYLVIGGPVGREPAAFRLWFWSGRADSGARPVEVPGLSGLEHAEGICAARLEGQSWVVLVSDDGNRQEGRCAQYALLHPNALRIVA
jgi:hypothetical protein